MPNIPVFHDYSAIRTYQLTDDEALIRYKRGVLFFARREDEGVTFNGHEYTVRASQKLIWVDAEYDDHTKSRQIEWNGVTGRGVRSQLALNRIAAALKAARELTE